MKITFNDFETMVLWYYRIVVEALHFIYLYNYNTNSTEDLSDMN